MGWFLEECDVMRWRAATEVLAKRIPFAARFTPDNGFMGDAPEFPLQNPEEVRLTAAGQGPEKSLHDIGVITRAALGSRYCINIQYRREAHARKSACSLAIDSIYSRCHPPKSRPVQSGPNPCFQPV